MPWRVDAPQVGFSDGVAWLPLGGDHDMLAVDRQDADPGSMLGWTRQVLTLRKTHAALRYGAMRVADTGDALRVFERTVPVERLLCVLNLSASMARWVMHAAGRVLVSTRSHADARLTPHAALVVPTQQPN